MSSMHNVAIRADDLEKQIQRSLEGLKRHLAYLNRKIDALTRASVALKSHGRYIQIHGHSTRASPRWVGINAATRAAGEQANILAVRLEVLRRLTEHQKGEALKIRSRTTMRARSTRTPQGKTPLKHPEARRKPNHTNPT